MRYIMFAALPLMLAACDQIADQQMQGISDQVATDAEEQYAMARRSGSKIDICVQAGMVSAAWLQAKNEAKYASAKATEKVDCAAAGVS